MDALGPALQIFKQMLVRAREKGLELERLDFVEQGSPPTAVQMCGDFVEQQYRVRR